MMIIIIIFCVYYVLGACAAVKQTCFRAADDGDWQEERKNRFDEFYYSFGQLQMEKKYYYSLSICVPAPRA